MLLIFFLANQTAGAQWIEAKSAHYSIFYQSGYERDAEFTRMWLDRAEDLLKEKYGVAFRGFYVAFYLHPAPMETANLGLANLRCCSNGANGVKNGVISYLAPSAPAWKGYQGLTSLGLPKDDHYHAKIIMSEYITIGHYVVQESRIKTGGWRYNSAPAWFVQGLQEYDGIFHTTGYQSGRDSRGAVRVGKESPLDIRLLLPRCCHFRCLQWRSHIHGTSCRPVR
jgi:hypothetical protein